MIRGATPTPLPGRRASWVYDSRRAVESLYGNVPPRGKFSRLVGSNGVESVRQERRGMPFRVRRRSRGDGSLRASLLRCSGGCVALAASPPDLLSFERDLQGVTAPDHPVRAEVVVGHQRRATALVSLSACSDPLHPGPVTRRVRTSRSPAGACHPVVSGATRHVYTLRVRAVLAHAPPITELDPEPGGETCLAAAIARVGVP
jgi:hypothetical protein